MVDSKLDRIDLKILAHLQRDGRITNANLSDAVALSPSPCLTRVKRLEKLGYILSYNANIALHKLGDTLTIFTEITLGGHHREDFARFEKNISAIDEVIECHLVSGGYDYLLKFVTRGIDHYQELMEEVITKEFGIDKYFSYVVLKSPVVKLHYPLHSLFEINS